MFALIITLIVLTVASLALLPGAVVRMRRAARQADVLAFRAPGAVKGRHVKRSARHARATRILAAHRA